MFNKIFTFLFFSLLLSCGDSLTYQQKLNNYNDFTNKADSLIKKEDYFEAIKYSNSALSITDTLSTAFIQKGIILSNLKKLEEAEESFDEAIDIEGETSAVYKLRALVHLKNKDSDFLDDINIYLENHDDEEAIELRRSYYEQENKLDKAIEEYSSAINKEPKNIDLILKRGQLYIKNGDEKMALKDFERVITFAPNNELANSKKIKLERHYPVKCVSLK